MKRSRRLALIAIGSLVVVALAVVPVFGTEPSATPAPARQDEPGTPPKPGKVPATRIAVNGTVVAATDEDGRTEYTVTSGGTTYRLDAGPRWWWGGDHPLEAFVGTSVTIAGTTRAGLNRIDVTSIDGTAIAGVGHGKPPWAGGPRKVGEKHPGWKAWKASGAERAKGRVGAPGQLEPKPSPDDEDDAES